MTREQRKELYNHQLAYELTVDFFQKHKYDIRQLHTYEFEEIYDMIYGTEKLALHQFNTLLSNLKYKIKLIFKSKLEPK